MIRSPVRDHDLAEVVLALEVPVGFFRLGEGEDLVDHRLEAAGLDGAVHRFEHLLAADVEALHAQVPAQDRHGIDLRHAGEQADDGDPAAEAGRGEGAGRGGRGRGALPATGTRPRRSPPPPLPARPLRPAPPSAAPPAAGPRPVRAPPPPIPFCMKQPATRSPPFTRLTPGPTATTSPAPS